MMCRDWDALELIISSLALTSPLFEEEKKAMEGKTKIAKWISLELYGGRAGFTSNRWDLTKSMQQPATVTHVSHPPNVYRLRTQMIAFWRSLKRDFLFRRVFDFFFLRRFFLLICFNSTATLKSDYLNWICWLFRRWFVRFTRSHFSVSFGNGNI